MSGQRRKLRVSLAQATEFFDKPRHVRLGGNRASERQILRGRIDNSRLLKPSEVRLLSQGLDLD